MDDLDPFVHGAMCRKCGRSNVQSRWTDQGRERLIYRCDCTYSWDTMTWEQSKKYRDMLEDTPLGTIVLGP